MADKLWKASERKIARILGGERVPVTGRARGNVPDVAHPWLSVEVKSRRSLPAWLLKAVAQARAAATPHQLPIAVLHQEGGQHNSDLVVMTLGDFKDCFGVGLGQDGGRQQPIRVGDFETWLMA